MRKARSFAIAFALLMLPAAALADTLYVAAPPAVGPGHPLRLGPDHRAAQVGDLLHIEFNFAVQSNSSDISNQSKQFSVGSSNGTGGGSGTTGIRLLGGLVNIPTSLGGNTGSQSSRTETGTTSFISDMMATVVNVLPSGVLQIAGDQNMAVNGQNQTLHITGFVRPEDIDSSDTVLSSRVADVQGTFNGNFQEKKVGLIRRILNWLF
jgi:flagellar L-ring protein precursor FlgH